MTIDPVSTAIQVGGLTAGIQPVLQRSRRNFPAKSNSDDGAKVEKALGDRWQQFAARKTFDPGNRL